MKGRIVPRHASGSPRPVVEPWPAEAVLKDIRRAVESSLSGPVPPYAALKEIDRILTRQSA
jgi:hypothetical protein